MLNPAPELSLSPAETKRLEVPKQIEKDGDVAQSVGFVGVVFSSAK